MSVADANRYVPILGARRLRPRLFCQIWVRIGGKYGKTPYALNMQLRLLESDENDNEL